MTKKTIILISTALAVIVALFALWSRATKGNDELNNRNSLISSKWVELSNLKYTKQNCLDNLTYLQSQEQYKWVAVYCNEWDEQIKQLKEELNTLLTNDYEIVDKTIKEKEVNDMTATEKLNFIMSEL